MKLYYFDCGCNSEDGLFPQSQHHPSLLKGLSWSRRLANILIWLNTDGAGISLLLWEAARKRSPEETLPKPYAEAAIKAAKLISDYVDASVLSHHGLEVSSWKQVMKRWLADTTNEEVKVQGTRCWSVPADDSKETRSSWCCLQHNWAAKHCDKSLGFLNCLRPEAPLCFCVGYISSAICSPYWTTWFTTEVMLLEWQPVAYHLIQVWALKFHDASCN